MFTPRSFGGSVRAPEFPPLEWLNTERPLSLADLRGKVVLLDFWTYGCINCMHVIPDLKRLEEKYSDALVVIGVHSAKFRNEGETENLRQIVLRYELEHPVANDRDFLVWRAYGVRAWPTLVLIDPQGRVVGKHAGEQVFEPFDQVIGRLIREFDAKGEIDRRPLELTLEQGGLPETALSFPGKLLVDLEDRRLFIADSNHHRVVVANLDTLRVEHVIGGPEPGFVDGEPAHARFRHPQGMALGPNGRKLYVADTENHAIRLIDLGTESVTTVVGTGRQSREYPGRGGRAPTIDLNSPWDLELIWPRLYIAMAGSHQLWLMSLESGMIGPWAGSGREGIDDGPSEEASLAQPSGLATDGEWLYFTDPETSAIRRASLDDGHVRTLVGTGLFDFGDQDGQGADARLQHALGIAFRPADGLLYVADTYNSKLKTVDPMTAEVSTLLGEGRGWRDGAAPLFYEPGGLDVAGDLLYVADTNNQAVRIVELGSLQTRTAVLRDIHALLAPAEQHVEEVVELTRQHLRPGDAVLRLDVDFPPGLRPDRLTPLSWSWLSNPIVAFPGGRQRRRLVGPAFPAELPLRLRSGDAAVEADVTVPYCGGGNGEPEQLCFVRTLRVRLPMHVAEGGDDTLSFRYALPRLEEDQGQESKPQPGDRSRPADEPPDEVRLLQARFEPCG